MSTLGICSQAENVDKANDALVTAPAGAGKGLLVDIAHSWDGDVSPAI
jgi:hypothetical protein